MPFQVYSKLLICFACYKPECDANIQVSQFLFGDGFAVSGGDQWRVRRKAVNPALHKAYLNTMIDRVFAPSALHLADKLQVITAPSKSAVKQHVHTYSIIIIIINIITIINNNNNYAFQLMMSQVRAGQVLSFQSSLSCASRKYV